MDQLQQWIDDLTGPATAWLTGVNDWLYTYIMIIALVGTGIFLTIKTRAVQFRHFGRMAKYVVRSRAGADGGISSFQAFAMGMATRIGIGNITGVALAIVLGGPGALFWMWIVALIGMSTGFAEATLAQIFKRRHGTDNTYRGGPAYYIQKGTKSRALAVTFAIAMIFSMSVAMPMVQSNTVAQVISGSHGVEPWITGVIVAILTGLVVFFGVRGVARASEVLSPIMAIFYVVVATIVVLLNIGSLPQFFVDVFTYAFGARELAAGAAGGIVSALLNGVRRGLFSNEAGMGTSPNAAGTASVSHPVYQGLIQSFGVFVDTVFICSSTGFIILTTGVVDWKTATADDSAQMTTVSIVDTLGSWMAWPVSIMIFFFGFSSILGAFTYADANLNFLGYGQRANRVLAAVTTVFTALGGFLALTFVWSFMDTAMFVVTILNLVGILVLWKWLTGSLRDFEAQLDDEDNMVFDPHSKYLPAVLETDSWPAPVSDEINK